MSDTAARSIDTDEGMASTRLVQAGLSPTRRLLLRILQRLSHGSLSVVLPGGARLDRRGAHPGPEATILLHRWRSLWRLLTGGDIGFAEAYMEGDWSSPDLAALIELAAHNEHALPGSGRPSLPLRLANRLFHLLHANTRAGSKRNIMAHYDLGNEFYRAWLDEGMSYSSAIFSTEAETLESGQSAKQDRVLELLGAREGDRVLEIGCGWGGLARRIAEVGCHVTGLTLSPSQLDYASKHLAGSGLAGRSDLRLQDYRDVEGQFDFIVSIEMFEAVGEEYWPAYFAAIRNRLRPGGRAVLQIITIANDRFATYRAGTDFIQRYIFPGGMLPSPEVLEARIGEAGLSIVSRETFGESYARTLQLWRERFNENWPRISGPAMPERFRRMWDYYLAYCEGGFRAGSIDVALYVIRHDRL